MQKQSDAPKFSTKDGFAGIILLVIVVAVLVVGGAFYLGRQSAPPFGGITTPSTSPTPSATDETASWKTYTNPEHGFTIKYPSNMNIISEVLTGGKIGPDWIISFTDTSKEESATSGSNYSISVEIDTDPKNNKGEPITKKNINTLYVSGDSAYKVEETTIQNRLAVKIQSTSYANQPSVTHLILDNNRLIRLYGASNDSTNFSLEDIDQILSTFRFD